MKVLSYLAYIYIIGTANIIILLGIQNDCRIFFLLDLFEINMEKQEEKL